MAARAKTDGTAVKKADKRFGGKLPKLTLEIFEKYGPSYEGVAKAFGVTRQYVGNVVLKDTELHSQLVAIRDAEREDEENWYKTVYLPAAKECTSLAKLGEVLGITQSRIVTVEKNHGGKFGKAVLKPVTDATIVAESGLPQLAAGWWLLGQPNSEFPGTVKVGSILARCAICGTVRNASIGNIKRAHRLEDDRLVLDVESLLDPKAGGGQSFTCSRLCTQELRSRIKSGTWSPEEIEKEIKKTLDT